MDSSQENYLNTIGQQIDATRYSTYSVSGLVALQANSPYETLTSRMGTGLCPGDSTSDSAPCLQSGKSNRI